jgi:hypothetical protein
MNADLTKEGTRRASLAKEAPSDEVLDVEIIEDETPDRGWAHRAENSAAQAEGSAARAANSAADQARRAEDSAAGGESLAPLFTAEATADFRSRWDIVQRGFVDDPIKAVRDGDELVSEVIRTLAQTFTDERTGLEARDDQRNRTEMLRQALRRHRALFERLLSF